VGTGCCSLVRVRLVVLALMVLASRSAGDLAVLAAVEGGVSCSDSDLGMVGSPTTVGLGEGSRQVAADHHMVVVAVVGRRTGGCGLGIVAGSVEAVVTWTIRGVLRSLGGP